MQSRVASGGSIQQRKARKDILESSFIQCLTRSITSVWLNRASNCYVALRPIAFKKRYKAIADNLPEFFFII
jgi:hypothetical protein